VQRLALASAYVEHIPGTSLGNPDKQPHSYPVRPTRSGE